MEIKFLKSKRNKIILGVSLCILMLVFAITYFVTFSFNSKKNGVDFVNKNTYEVALKNNTKELIIVDTDKNGEFFEKSKMKIDILDINRLFTEIYPLSGYEIIDFNNKSITIKETSNKKFEPNMYYIGEKNGYITVFRSDDNGDLFIENESSDISSKKVDLLPTTDRELVLNYELKSNERGEVEYILSELET